MPNIVRPYRKLMAVGCSHGKFIDEIARDTVLRFSAAWKPDIKVHLGDAFDTAAMRSGAYGTSDEDESVMDDLDEGISFINAYEPTHFTLGNHDWRIWKLLDHHNGIVRDCASECVKKIDAATKALKCNTYPYMGVWNATDPRGVCWIGDYRFMHGTWYGENATRDYAERIGKVVHAHTHRAAMSKGRRDDSPTAFGSGCLMDPTKADYANTRAATLGWSAGIVYGEVAMGRRPQCYLVLAERPRGAKEWRVPGIC